MGVRLIFTIPDNVTSGCRAIPSWVCPIVDHYIKSYEERQPHKMLCYSFVMFLYIMRETQCNIGCGLGVIGCLAFEFIFGIAWEWEVILIMVSMESIMHIMDVIYPVLLCVNNLDQPNMNWIICMFPCVRRFHVNGISYFTGNLPTIPFDMHSINFNVLSVFITRMMATTMKDEKWIYPIRTHSLTLSLFSR